MITPRNLLGFNKIKFKKKNNNLITSMLHEMEKEPNTIRSLIKMEENLILSQNKDTTIFINNVNLY